MLNNVRDIYYHLHQYPELSYNEFETTKYILNYLEKYPIKTYKLEPTGVVAVIDKGHEETIAFRTDIDALPIQEANDCEYKSKVNNVMHACGHDGHITMILQLISNIFENKINYQKNLMFIFQPAEEVDGGAKIVLDSEVFSRYNVKNVFGMHLWPELKKGLVGLKANELMGTNFVFELNIHGKSAHASTPQNGVDACQALSELIQNINFIIAKTTGPFEPAIINIGKIQGGVAANVIIDNILVNGTIRASNDNTLAKVVAEFRNVVSAIESKYGTKIDLIQKEITYPAVINSPQVISDVVDKLKNNSNFEICMLDKPTLACEDFGFYCQKFQSGFFFLGTQEEEHSYMLHSPNFSFDTEILTKGVELYEHLLEIYG